MEEYTPKFVFAVVEYPDLEKVDLRIIRLRKNKSMAMFEGGQDEGEENQGEEGIKEKVTLKVLEQIKDG